jgi:hypothetical protein
MTETTKQPTSQEAPAERGPYRVVIVDDHAMFRTGVKAEIGRSVAVVGEAADAERAIAVILQTHRTWCCLTCTCLVAGVEVIRKVHEKNPGPEVPCAISLRRSRGCHRRDPGRRPRLRHEIDQRQRADRCHPPSRRRDAVFSPRLAGFVLDAFSGPLIWRRR